MYERMRKDTRERLENRDRAIKNLSESQVKLLFSVPRRGTYHWELREALRLQMGCKVICFGGINE